LKSSYYLDEETITKVCSFTGVSKKEILSMQSRLNRTLGTKIKRRDSCIRCRNNAFYFHRKYSIELRNICPNSTWATLIQNKYSKQTQTWINKNTRLRRKDYYVSVSNCEIGKILNMDPRHVKYVINKAKENVDILTQNQYHIKHENLSCNGKPK